MSAPAAPTTCQAVRIVTDPLPEFDPLVPSARDAVDRIAYSPAEAARALGCTRQTIYALIDRGELRRYKIGRSTKLNAAEVHALVGGGVSA
jgi:excisionase family DNA binding protein